MLILVLMISNHLAYFLIPNQTIKALLVGLLQCCSHAQKGGSLAHKGLWPIALGNYEVIMHNDVQMFCTMPDVWWRGASKTQAPQPTAFIALPSDQPCHALLSQFMISFQQAPSRSFPACWCISPPFKSRCQRSKILFHLRILPSFCLLMLWAL